MRIKRLPEINEKFMAITQPGKTFHVVEFATQGYVCDKIDYLLGINGKPQWGSYQSSAYDASTLLEWFSDQSWALQDASGNSFFSEEDVEVEQARYYVKQYIAEESEREYRRQIYLQKVQALAETGKLREYIRNNMPRGRTDIHGNRGDPLIWIDEPELARDKRDYLIRVANALAHYTGPRY